MSRKKKFVGDVAITFVSSVVTLMMNFLSSIILSRTLGPSDLGIYKMTLSIYNIAIVFSSFGLPSTVIKYVAESDEEVRKSILTATMALSFFLGLITSFLLYLLSNPLSEFFGMPLSDTILFISLVFPISLMNNILFSALNGMRRMRLSALINIFQSSSTLLLLILLLPRFRVLGAIWSFVSSLFLSFLLLMISNRSLIKIDLDAKDACLTLLELLRFSRNIFLSSAVNIINYQIGTLAIGYFLLPSDVGYYSIALSLSQFFFLFPYSVQKITYPSTSYYWSRGEVDTLRRMINKSMKYTTMILVPLGLLAEFLAKDVVVLLYGQDFLPSAFLLQIMLLGTVFNGVTSKPIAGTLAGVGRADIEAKRSILSAIIDVVLTLSFVPILGSVGAAISRSLMFIVGSTIGLILIKRILDLSIDKIWYAKLFLALSISLLIYLSSNLLFSNLISSIISTSSFLLLEMILLMDEEDKKLISDILSEFKRNVIFWKRTTDRNA